VVASRFQAARGPCPRPCASRPAVTQVPTARGSNRTIFQYARAMHSRTHRCAPNFRCSSTILYSPYRPVQQNRGHWQGFKEGDIASGLAAGGRILGIFVVERALSGGPKYILPASKLEARVSRSQDVSHRSDRVYRDFDRLVLLIRDEFGYSGPITLPCCGRTRIATVPGALPEDGRDSVSSDLRSHPGAPLRAVRPGLTP
jgi:hypothetical protein